MLEAKNLMIRFPQGNSIRYKDCTFETGKSYVLLGASGCGKSTLLNMLAGVVTPTEGMILLNGHDMAKETQRVKDTYRIRSIGYIFQDFKLIEEMTVEDNINILRLEGIDVSRMSDAMQEMGIASLRKRRVATLSGGEKQRVAIVRAIVKNPEIILADEPTGNLNYAVGKKVVDELLHTAHGKTLICVTHDDRLAEFFDEVLDMNQIAVATEGDD